MPEPFADARMPQTVEVSRREWWLALALAGALALLLLVPYWVAYESARPGTAFSGTLMNPDDSQTYFAKMNAGAAGEWLYQVPFTSEPHDPFFVGIFYITLGQIARTLDLSTMAVWHGARFVTGVIMFVAIFGFVAAFFPTRGARWTAFLLASLGSGFGWLLFLLGVPYWLDTFPVDFRMAEARPFFTALTFPHIALTTALLLFSFWMTLAFFQHEGRVRWLYAAAAGLGNLLIALFHPLLVYVFVLTGSLYWLVRTLQARRILWQQGFALALSFLLPGLVALYYSYLVTTNPVFAAWNARRGITVSPPWPHFVIAYGPLLLFAALLWLRPRTRRQWVQTPPALFLWLWALAVALLVYAPLGSQRRFVQGVHVGLAILATAGFLYGLLPRLLESGPLRRLTAHPRYSRRGLVRFFAVIFLGLMSLSNLYVFTSVTVSAVIQQPDLLFRPEAELAATAWLQSHSSPDTLLLGAPDTGNYVAAHAGNRVIAGHWAETIDFPEKAASVTRFFDAGTSTAWREQFLAAYDVDYVWFGPREQALGAFDPASAPFLDPVYEQDGIRIYAVSR